MNFITTPEHFRSVLIKYLISLGRGPAYYENIVRQRNSTRSSSFNFLFSFMVQDSAKVGFTLKTGGELLDFGASLQHQNSVQKEQASIMRYSKNINDFYGWLAVNEFDINYQKIVEAMLPIVTSELFTSFPLLGRIMRGLEVYPLKKPSASATLAVSKYKQQGVEKPYMIYNPKFIIDSIVADILADKYAPAEMFLILRYMIVHELYHLAKGQLSGWTQEKVKHLNPTTVNMMMDLGINASICRQGNQAVVDSAISPGLYFDYIVKVVDKTVDGFVSLVTVYGNRNIANSVDSILDDLKVNDTFRLTLGSSLEDVSEFMFELDRLISSGAIMLKTNSREELKDSLNNAVSGQKKPDVPTFAAGDVVINMVDFSILMVVNSDAKKSRVHYLGRIFSLRDIFSLPQKIAVLKSTSQLLEVPNTQLFLSSIDFLTVPNIVRVGDIVQINNTEYGRCTQISSSGLTIETIDTSVLKPEEMYLSFGNFMSRIIAGSSVKQRGIVSLVTEVFEEPSIGSDVVAETEVESENSVKEDDSIDYHALASKILKVRV